MKEMKKGEKKNKGENGWGGGRTEIMGKVLYKRQKGR